MEEAVFIIFERNGFILIMFCDIESKTIIALKVQHVSSVYSASLPFYGTGRVEVEEVAK